MFVDRDDTLMLYSRDQRIWRRWHTCDINWFACHIDPTTPFSRRPHLHIWFWCSNWFHFSLVNSFFFLSYPLSSILCSNADASNLKCCKCTCNLLYSMLCCVCLCARWKSSFSISLFPYILFHPPTVFISLIKCCCCFISYKFRLHPIWW